MCSQNCNWFWILAPGPFAGPAPKGDPLGRRSGGALELCVTRKWVRGLGTFPQEGSSPHSPEPRIEGDPKTGWGMRLRRRGGPQ